METKIKMDMPQAIIKQDTYRIDVKPLIVKPECEIYGYGTAEYYGYNKQEYYGFYSGNLEYV